VLCNVLGNVLAVHLAIASPDEETGIESIHSITGYLLPQVHYVSGAQRGEEGLSRSAGAPFKWNWKREFSIREPVTINFPFPT
jgi:hypothetical protein